MLGARDNSFDRGLDDERNGPQSDESSKSPAPCLKMTAKVRVEASTRTSSKIDSAKDRDSGYASLAPTPDSKSSGAVLQTHSTVESTGPQLKGLSRSSTPMSPKVMRRLNEVRAELGKMLADHLRNGRFIPRTYKPIVMRPMMLGKPVAEPKPHMVVMCPKQHYKKIQQFFDQPLVKSLCKPNDNDLPAFEVLVVDEALRLRSGTGEFRAECCVDNPTGETFCGMPLKILNEAGDAQNGTFGGLVKVVPQKGDFQIYGLTAGHLLQTLSDSGSEGNPQCLEHDDCSSQCRMTSESPSPADSDTSHEPWAYTQSRVLGKVLNTHTFSTDDDGVDFGQSSLDWVLFQIDPSSKWWPNLLPSTKRTPEKKELVLASEIDPAADPIPVKMICGSEGPRSGWLMPSPVQAMLESSDEFVDVYLLSLKNSKISDGDCGSWVINRRREVYGHAVGDDVFGDIYVIPMTDIFKDVGRCLRARSVEMPSRLDILSVRCRGASVIRGEAQQRYETTTTADKLARIPPADSGYSSKQMSPAGAI